MMNRWWRDKLSRACLYICMGNRHAMYVLKDCCSNAASVPSNYLTWLVCLGCVRMLWITVFKEIWSCIDCVLGIDQLNWTASGGWVYFILSNGPTKRNFIKLPKQFIYFVSCRFTSFIIVEVQVFTLAIAWLVTVSGTFVLKYLFTL